MAGFAQAGIAPALGAVLDDLGGPTETPLITQGIPSLARGANIVAVLPPSPERALPLLAAMISREINVLLLAHPAMVGEWSITANVLLGDADLPVQTVRRAERDAADAHARLTIIAPQDALAWHGRSQLGPERFGAVIFAWPEDWNADQAVTALLADIPREAQRVVLTSNHAADAVQQLVERYARKAMLITVGLSHDSDAQPAPQIVRTAPSPWSTRAETVLDVLEALPDSAATVVTSDRRDHERLRRILGSRAAVAILGATQPANGRVICYDLPTRAELAVLGRDVVVLTPPATEAFVSRLAPQLTPLDIHPALAPISDRDARLRAEIANVIREGNLVGALYAVAPMFEQTDPQLVAAALFTLWQDQPKEAASRAPATTTAPRLDQAVRVWIGAGRKDGATVADFVAVLVREVGMDRAQIGRIELRDTFTLVEVPAQDAEAIATRLTGLTIRKRKLLARVDSRRAAQRGGP